MTTFVAVASAAVGCAVLLAAVLIVVRLLAYHSADRALADQAEYKAAGFSLARYAPMARLLAEDDFLFLTAQPGYRPEIGKKWRRERLCIFRLYLRDLARDFQNLHAEARALVADSREEYSELVGVLMRQQITFWRAMAGLELRLWMAQFGIGWQGLGNLGARRLVDSIEAMRHDLARFAAPLPTAL